MYKPGTIIEVKVRIEQGQTVIDPGTRGEILEGFAKMVGKSYSVKLEDGRTVQLHIVILNNQTEVVTKN